MINLQNLLDAAKCYESVRQLRWSDGVRCPLVARQRSRSRVEIPPNQRGGNTAAKGAINDLEQMFGGLRHQLCRATGQKNAPASLVVCGTTRLPAAVASQTHCFTAEELASADLRQWQIVRARREQRRWPRVLGRRFWQDPDAYLQALEECLIKLSLPP